jgi:hypothetical protein
LISEELFVASGAADWPSWWLASDDLVELGVEVPEFELESDNDAASGVVNVEAVDEEEGN